MILDLHRQGLSVSAIARKLELDRKTVRRYIQRGLEPPCYGPRAPRPQKLDPYRPYLADRIRAYPGLSGVRLLREARALGYTGGYTAIKLALQELRPPPAAGFEHRFETGPGEQAQVDFAQFKTEFGDDPGQTVALWLFTLVLGHSRYLWGEFVWHQDLMTVLRCHVAAFAALGGVPRQILYDRMKTAVLGEVADGIIYNAQLQALARHYGFTPRACAAYRAKTKGEVERPYRYVRQDFFLGRQFQNLEDLNAQFRDWRDGIANRRRHGTTHRPIESAFAAEQRVLPPPPALRFDAVVRLERRLSRDGCVAFNGHDYSVPDGVRGRTVEVQVSLAELRIFADGRLVASHPLASTRRGRHFDPAHRRWPPPSAGERRRAESGATLLSLPGDRVGRRPLAVYEQVGAALAAGGGR